ncbi:hypothetical protein EDB86DRAFT_3179047 [Lactarius hatsudake]|nr:hypothetical protein EDB86DRAFT_3179047 [Lactarius hatsudake]
MVYALGARVAIQDSPAYVRVHAQARHGAELLRLVSPATVNFTVEGGREAVSVDAVSTGSDEVIVQCYQDDAQIQQEMVLDFNLTLSNYTIALGSALDIGPPNHLIWCVVCLHRAFPSNTDPGGHGLDCGASGWVDNNPGGNSWCRPFKTWKDAHHVPPSLLIFRRQPCITQGYTFDPLANLTAAQAPLVLGGQQQLWTEQPGPQSLDSIVWPRAATSAGVFWSGAGSNVSAALPSLHELRYRFRNRGVQAIALPYALRPFACDLTV